MRIFHFEINRIKTLKELIEFTERMIQSKIDFNQDHFLYIFSKVLIPFVKSPNFPDLAEKVSIAFKAMPIP